MLGDYFENFKVVAIKMASSSNSRIEKLMVKMEYILYEERQWKIVSGIVEAPKEGTTERS